VDYVTFLAFHGHTLDKRSHLKGFLVRGYYFICFTRRLRSDYSFPRRRHFT